MHSVELKRTNIQKLKSELQQIERDTETRLSDIDNGNIQLKVKDFHYLNYNMKLGYFVFK